MFNFTFPSEKADNTVVLSTNSSGYFADSVAKLLGIKRLSVIRKAFGDGEEYYRVDLENFQELLNKDIIYVSSTANDYDFLELIRVSSALATSYGVNRLVFVIPFMGYSTMERATRAGEVVTAKTNCRMLSSIPSCTCQNSFFFMDLHVAGILHYFEGSSLRHELYAEEALVKGLETVGIFESNKAKPRSHSIRDTFIDIKDLTDQPNRKFTAPATLGVQAATSLCRIDNKDIVFGSADLGRPKWVSSFARRYDTDLAFIQKTRSFEQTEIKNIIGNVKDKVVIIYDDMTRSGGTLIQAANCYKEHGAKDIIAVLSHCALCNEDVIDKLINSCISKIISTNTHPMSQSPRIQNSDKFHILDVSTIFAQNLHTLLV